MFQRVPLWWCADCRIDVRGTICSRCGHTARERRVRCRSCGQVGRLTARVCPRCGERLVPLRPDPVANSPAVPIADAVVRGVLVEDRTPAAPAPLLGAIFAPVPRRVPWLDILLVVMEIGTLASILWLDLGTPGWAVILIIAIPFAVIGLVRRFNPDLWQRLLTFAAPLLRWIANRIPQVRRLILQSESGQLVGVQIENPQRWPPRRAFPPDAPLRLVCHGEWLAPNRLMRADRVEVIDEAGHTVDAPIDARVVQTLPAALGIIGLILVTTYLVRHLFF